MAAGLPVIGTRCGGPEGFVTDDVGILVDVDDVDALAAAMKKMIEDKDKYDSEKVRKYAIDNFSPTVVVQKLLALYERVLKIPI
jgi:glycosyltransferase involved in cell wall biosynthesis